MYGATHSGEGGNVNDHVYSCEGMLAVFAQHANAQSCKMHTCILTWRSSTVTEMLTCICIHKDFVVQKLIRCAMVCIDIHTHSVIAETYAHIHMYMWNNVLICIQVHSQLGHYQAAEIAVASHCLWDSVTLDLGHYCIAQISVQFRALSCLWQEWKQPPLRHLTPSPLTDVDVKVGRSMCGHNGRFDFT